MKSILKRVKDKVFGKNGKPILTNITYEKPLLHIGCGDIDLQGWINIDARPDKHVHILTNEITLNQFTDGSVGAIYLSHVLEHFDFKESELLLKTFHRKLRSGGILLLAVPDFSALAGIYAETKKLSVIEQPLMGGQSYEYNYHKSVYDEQLLTEKLLAVGFRHVERYDPKSEFGREIGDFSTHHVSGRLISLNVKAIK